MSTRLMPVDVAVMGLGATGGVAVLPLARAGLKIAGIEAGTWMDPHRDFHELTKSSTLSLGRGGHALRQHVLFAMPAHTVCALRNPRERATNLTKLIQIPIETSNGKLAFSINWT